MEVCIKVHKEHIETIRETLAHKVQIHSVNTIEVKGYKILNTRCEGVEGNNLRATHDENDTIFRQVENEDAYCALVENEEGSRAGFGYYRELGWWVIFDTSARDLHTPEDPVGVVFQALGGSDSAPTYQVVNGDQAWWKEE